jgi:xanthine dehydrogenase YagS FAD-binding subunit
VLERGDLITAVELPPLPFAATRSAYRKVRERASYAFAAVSVAAALDVEGGRIRAARIALGGVAHTPWRAGAAERVLAGAPVEPATFERAAEAELAPARAGTHSGYKIPLARQVMARALEDLARRTA